MLRTIVALITASAIALAVAGCDGDEPPDTTPTPSVTSTPTASPSSSPTVPAYLEEYAPDERAAYEAAAKDYESFADRNAEFYAEGRATQQAKSFYTRYTAARQSYWARLQEFEQQGYQIRGEGEILRMRPVSVRAGDDGGEVTLDACGISSGVTLSQNGTPVPQPTPTPTNVRVRMVQLPEETWWRVLDQKVGDQC